MKRLFLVYDDKDFAEWIEGEMTEYGRFIRSIDSLDFFFPQWNAVGFATDVIILPETVFKADDAFLKIYNGVKNNASETIFLLIYHREKDQFIAKLESEGNVCVSFEELETGLLESRLRNRNVTYFPNKANTVIAKPENDTNKNNDDDMPPQAQSHSSKETVEQTVPIQENEKSINDSLHTDQEMELPQDQLKSAEGEVLEEVTPKKRRTAEEQKAKLKKIKERIVIEEKIVTVHVPVHFNSMLISVISLYPRAGATFVTSNFARMLGENKVPVAVFEPVLQNIGSTYYELLHGETRAPKEWRPWAEQIQNEGYISQEKSWISHGVNWIPSNITPTSNWNEEQTMLLLLASKRFPVALCDISSSYNVPQCKKIISMSDEIWIVADGDPVQLSHHLHSIDALKSEFPGKQMKVIGNKWSKYIKQTEWKDAVVLPTLAQVPDLGNIVLKHSWDGNLAWDDEKLKNILAIQFKPLARSVMAKEMYGLMKKQYGFGAKVRRFFKQMKSLDDESKTRNY